MIDRKKVTGMKQPLDRIVEARFDGMGENVGQMMREKIFWICEQAKGEKILDIGCSKGVVIDLILSREGKNVLAIDPAKECIDYAKIVIENESESTKSNMDFQEINFISHDFKNQKFDVIIFLEMLEHTTDSARFINKAKSLLSKKGRIIVTLPFGVNINSQNDKVYYIMDFLNLLPDGLRISEYIFLEQWSGFVLETDVEGVSLAEIFSSMEKNFYIKDKRLSSVNEENKIFEKKMVQLTENNIALKEELQQNKEHEQILASRAEALELAKEELKIGFGKLEQEKKDLTEQFGDQLKKLSTQLDDSEQEKSHSNEKFDAQLKQLNIQLEKSEQEKIVLNEQLAHQLKQLQNIEITSSEEILKEQIEKLEKEKAILFDQFGQQFENLQAEINRTSEEDTQLEFRYINQIKILEEEKSSLAKQVEEKFGFVNEVLRHKELIENRLFDKIQELELEQKHSISVNRALAKAESERSWQTERVLELTHSLEEATNRTELLAQEERKLRTSWSRAKENLEISSQENQKLRTSWNRAKENLEALNQENQKLRTSWNRAKENLEASNQENQKLRKSWNSSKESLEESIQSIQILKSDMNEVKQEIVVAEQKQKWLRTSWDKTKEELAASFSDAHKLRNSWEKSKDELTHYKKAVTEEQTQKLIISKKEKIRTEGLLIDAYKKEQALLKSYLTLKEAHEQLEEKYTKLEDKQQVLLRKQTNLERKYNSLSKSRLGSITLSYWQLKKKRK